MGFLMPEGLWVLLPQPPSHQTSPATEPGIHRGLLSWILLSCRNKPPCVLCRFPGLPVREVTFTGQGDAACSCLQTVALYPTPKAFRLQSWYPEVTQNYPATDIHVMSTPERHKLFQSWGKRKPFPLYSQCNVPPGCLESGAHPCPSPLSPTPRIKRTAGKERTQ